MWKNTGNVDSRREAKLLGVGGPRPQLSGGGRVTHRDTRYPQKTQLAPQSVPPM